MVDVSPHPACYSSVSSHFHCICGTYLRAFHPGESLHRQNEFVRRRRHARKTIENSRCSFPPKDCRSPAKPFAVYLSRNVSWRGRLRFRSSGDSGSFLSESVDFRSDLDRRLSKWASAHKSKARRTVCQEAIWKRDL